MRLPRRMETGGRAAAPLWFVTYADMVTLILGFFILLASFSTIDKHKLNTAVTSVQSALGSPSGLVSGPAYGGEQQQLPIQRDRGKVSHSIEKAAREIQNRMQVLGLASGVDIKFDAEGGMLISLPSKILFDFGKADLRPEAYEIVNQLATSLGGIEGVFIEVRGHTDNVPLGPTSPFQDNYDLSYHRAKNVMVQLTGPGGIAERDCEVVACGPSQPVADNNTEDGRQANRRVELYVRGKASPETLQDVAGKLGTGRSRPAQPVQPTPPAAAPLPVAPKGV